MSGTDIWSFRRELGGVAGLAGYAVEARDGSIGKIDEATDDVGGSHVVVDTGPWIFGKTVILPAGTITRVDHVNREVHVDRTREQVKNAPEYDPETGPDESYRTRLGDYYGEGGAGWADDASGSSAVPTRESSRR